MKQIVYKLIDPRTLQVMYIGVTSGETLIERVCKHVASARRAYDKSGYPKDGWLIELARLNMLPGYEVIEVVTDGTGYKREIYWISEYRKSFPNLFNKASGGAGVSLPGELHPASKLTDEDAKVVRHLYGMGGYTQLRLAKMFNMTRSGMQKVLNGKRRNNKVPITYGKRKKG